MIISVSVPVQRNGRLMVEATKYGVSADRVEVDVEAQRVYVDLFSDDVFRTLKVGVLAGAEFHAAVDHVEHGEKVRVYPNRQSEDEKAALRKGE